MIRNLPVTVSCGSTIDGCENLGSRIFPLSERINMSCRRLILMATLVGLVVPVGKGVRSTFFIFRLPLTSARGAAGQTLVLGHLTHDVDHGRRAHAAELSAQHPQRLPRQRPRQRDGQAAGILAVSSLRHKTPLRNQRVSNVDMRPDPAAWIP